jgi:acetyl esterase/lipase
MHILLLKSRFLAISAILVILSAAAGIAHSQELTPPTREIQLYPGTAPGSEAWDYSERFIPGRNPRIQNVVRPVLQHYPADRNKAVGTAMIVAPGGGFQNLMMSYEGVDIAKRLNEMGVEAFVLKYRLIYTNPNNQTAGQKSGTTSKDPQAGQNLREMAALDGQRAVRLLREHAAEFGFPSNRIGMMGFSAGGFVTVATVMGPLDGRPNFAAPIYPATGERFGQPPIAPAGAPPLFLAVAADDTTTGWQCCVDLFRGWQEAKVPVELHIFQSGAHGFVNKGSGSDHFMDRLEEWLRVNELLTPLPTP